MGPLNLGYSQFIIGGILVFSFIGVVSFFWFLIWVISNLSWG